MQWNGISSLKIDYQSICWANYLNVSIFVHNYRLIWQSLKKNMCYVWSSSSWYTYTCDVNCFNFSLNMDYKVSLSFEYTSFCVIIYLKIFPTTCTYNSFKILIKWNYIPTRYGGSHHHHQRESTSTSQNTHTHSQIHFASPINTECYEHRYAAPIKPLWTVEIQDIKVGTCTVFDTMTTIVILALE